MTRMGIGSLCAPEAFLHGVAWMNVHQAAARVDVSMPHGVILTHIEALGERMNVVHTDVRGDHPAMP